MDYSRRLRGRERGSGRIVGFPVRRERIRTAVNATESGLGQSMELGGML